uniref:Soluble scavenger receptor cysteine-rich domain-containing protein SSC5D n=1 Tax=Xenopus tropicalis TaxID=8364 RepID=A0A803JQ18_XENTR
MNVNCTGKESDLWECKQLMKFLQNCDHDQDVGVICSGEPEELRLVGGATDCEGRVEVKHRGEWGTVCGHDWGLEEATVVCRQLGCNSSLIKASSFGAGSGKIWLGHPRCTGKETALWKCNHRMWGLHYCAHHEDVGVVCAGEPEDVKLVGGSTRCEGRVEVKHRGTWGTVCNDGWNNNAALTVCKQLSCKPLNTFHEPIHNIYFGAGEGRIWLSGLSCTSEDKVLWDCKRNMWGLHKCRHAEDAGVICSDSLEDLRLVGGANQCEGRVEVKMKGQWGTVCGGDINREAKIGAVICRELGCNSTNTQATSFGAGSEKILLYDVSCKGTETSLLECFYTKWGVCRHNREIGVICAGEPEEMRLAGGSHDCEGRVEVKHRGEWGTVCSKEWSWSVAAVVCRQMGCDISEQTSDNVRADFGFGSGKIWLSLFGCSGEESALWNCNRAMWGLHECDHRNYVGVRCKVKPEQVRLVGGSSYCEGRVEVKILEQWGTVCSDNWDSNEARVLCQQLNCISRDEHAHSIQPTFFGAGSGKIWSVSCSGNEEGMKDCFITTGYPEYCNHRNDVGVICTDEARELRLSGGSHKCEGRVEVKHNGQWGTVCSNTWGKPEAAVVCRQMGCGFIEPTDHLSPHFFGAGSGRIWLGSVTCSGEELALWNCHHSIWGLHSCDHGNDVGVRCTAEREELRLVGGSSYCKGRLEIKIYGQWGTVCSANWEYSETKVVCSQLGCNASAEEPQFIKATSFGAGSGKIWLRSVRCSGNEKALGDCITDMWNPGDCDHRTDVGVICSGEPEELRLAGGSYECEGRVEVKHNGEWGSVCSKEWGWTEASVVCRQLGCSMDIPIDNIKPVFFGAGSGKIWIDNLRCTGEESSLGDCAHSMWGLHNCGHGDDVGVICPVKPEEVRLVDGSSRCEGRVEVKIYGQWGTVCGKSWSYNEARVVCSDLGCNSSAAYPHLYKVTSFGAGSGKIWIQRVRCLGKEKVLADCAITMWNPGNCDHTYDVGVICAGEPEEIRLSGGSHECEGRVEVKHQGEWGTVCSNNWGWSAAAVVCRQIGCSSLKPSEYSKIQFFGAGSGKIWLDNVTCSGEESALWYCRHLMWGLHNCDHGHDVGVRCPGKPQEMRLIDGSFNCEGRLEVKIFGQWGTVCSANWGYNEARVVCRQLGCLPSEEDSHFIQPTFFGPGSSTIWFQSVSCSGNEKALGDCITEPWNPGVCDHSADVGVICAGEPEELRLSAGSHECEGRVEVKHHGEWGTVCSREWDWSEANVVCRQLGCGFSGSLGRISAFFGAGSGKIWLAGLRCTGKESALWDCRHPMWGLHNCDHRDDVGVRCTAKPEELRLVGGSFRCEGRLEVKVYGQWGTVCNEHWNYYRTEARVICRQLGCYTSAKSPLFIKTTSFGAGSGKIWFHRVHCSGHAKALGDCITEPWNPGDCSHSADVGVICAGAPEGLRLVGGENECEGRVEVKFQGVWGTVTSSNWDVDAASVVCRQLGCTPSPTEIVKAVSFGPGTGKIWFNVINCLGKEKSLWNCKIEMHGIPWFDHIKDLGVICRGSLAFNHPPEAYKYPPKKNEIFGLDNADYRNYYGVLELEYDLDPVAVSEISLDPVSIFNDKLEELKLVGGASRCEGRVMVRFYGEWGSMCDYRWDMKKASVVCRQLGCNNSPGQHKAASFGPGSGKVWLSHVKCTGDEFTLSECKRNLTMFHNCDHTADVGVICAGGGPLELRLAGGSNRCEGRVEVKHHGEWGTVGDFFWDKKAATVVCRQLGCNTSYEQATSFGAGTGKIWFSGLKCTGNESALWDCEPELNRYRIWNNTADVGVICAGEPEELRLVGGTNDCEGRVEVKHRGEWGTVCANDWDTRDAAVVCRQLGCNSSLIKATTFGGGSGKIWLSHLQCTGKETSLWECKHGMWGLHYCNHGQDVGVICQGADENVRLIGGDNECEGRVEVKHQGTWGTVCGRQWGAKEASVVCRQLGCNTSNEYFSTKATFFGAGSGRIWLSNVKCTGDEPSLAWCMHNTWGIEKCDHTEDVGVICTGEPEELRLVGGNNECEGRVEVKHRGVWGAVCDHNWNQKAASVVCRQLGCNNTTEGQMKAQAAFFGQSSRNISLSRVKCTGEEAVLWECQHQMWGLSNCLHRADVGVICKGEPDLLRLVGGGTNCAGRVEVKHRGEWGTVCDDFWNENAAEVVCRQLGCSTSYEDTAHIKATPFGAASGKIWLSRVRCKGEESSLRDCDHNMWGLHYCSHSEDAGVICGDHREPRLVDGPNSCSGNLEVKHGGTWGSVCEIDDEFRTARVICRELGCGPAVPAPWKYIHNDKNVKSAQIWTEKIKCTGNESSLFECYRVPRPARTCTNPSSPTIHCLGPYSGFRLVNGTQRCSGRVEVLYTGQWGALCISNWDLHAANVLCRQLQCGTAVSIPNGRYFGKSDFVWTDRFHCKGTESHLGECSFAALGNSDCSRDDLAGVVCTGKEELMRLVDGESHCEGRLEVLQNSTWFSVTGEQWGLKEAQLVCRELHCGEARSAFTAEAQSAAGALVTWSDIKCKGNENNLTDCPLMPQPSSVPYANGKNRVGVICSESLLIRLVDSPHRCAGRVEVYHQGQWGTICGDSWDKADANVVCRQLNCGHAISISTMSHHETGNGTAWLSGINCTGSETALWQCPFNNWGQHSCTKKQDARVNCSEFTDLRLDGGSHECEGRLEVYYNGSWRSVCNNHMDQVSISVICRHLNCGTKGIRPITFTYGAADPPYWLDLIKCRKHDQSFWQCRSSPWAKHSCNLQAEVAEIKCKELLSTFIKSYLNG